MSVPRGDDEWDHEARRMGAMSAHLRQRFNNVMFILRYMQKHRDEYYSYTKNYEDGFKDGVLWSIKTIWTWWKGELPAVATALEEDIGPRRGRESEDGQEDSSATAEGETHSGGNNG